MSLRLIVSFNKITKRYFFSLDEQTYFFDEIRAIEKVPNGCVLHFFKKERGLQLDKDQATRLWARIGEFLETDPEGEQWQ